MTDVAVNARPSLDLLCINTVRTLAMDAVQKADSGHPGTPMALAPLCYVLWTRYLRHHPGNPSWQGRDRFVLSNGHASMLLYSLLYLTGYDLSLEDLKQFRQWGSRTPGHPEHGHTPGVETTTGPLGQGFGNAIGMAIAAQSLAAQFNRPGYEVMSHRVYFIASDGDIMEGISHEAASLAGHLRLGNVIGFYDDNHITIDGPTSLSLSDDTAQRFEAYGWQVQRVTDGNDLEAIDRAIQAAQREMSRPSLIIVRTHIAYGSPHKQDTAEAHGSPLGEEEVRLTKQNLGWPYEEPFTVPDEALEQWRWCEPRGAELEREWNSNFAAYASAHPALARELERRLSGELPGGWEQALPTFTPDAGAMATRTASGKVLNALAKVIPELQSASGDLHSSNKTLIKDGGTLGPEHPAGRNMYFGIREHAMAAAVSGMALHGGFIPFAGTFLIFSDYMRPAIRLAAMMGLKVIYVFTHDSIGLGEDGPTHQPIEHLASLRAMPGLVVVRPADAAETAEAWRFAIACQTGPVALVLTRQNVPTLDRTVLASAEGLRRGGYVLADAEGGVPRVVLLATGSEVALALETQRRLQDQGIATRVVSMPSLEVFGEQPEEYQTEVLPPSVTCRLAIEAAHPQSWYRWVGDQGQVLGLTHFGASAPYERIYEGFGLTAEAAVQRVHAMLRA